MLVVNIQKIDCRHRFLQSGKLWLYAILEGNVVGMLSIVINGDEWAWVSDLYVAELLRGKGIGYQLLQVAFEHAAAMEGIVGIAAGVDPENKPSSELFKGVGFVHTYSWKNDDGHLTRVWSRRFTTK